MQFAVDQGLRDYPPAAGRTLPVAHRTHVLPCSSAPVTWDRFSVASCVALPGRSSGAEVQ